MTNVRMCDECKTIEEGFSNWLNVEPDNQIISFTADVESTKNHHFCSWNCVADYSARIRDKVLPA